MDIEKIRHKIQQGEYRLSNHAQKCCDERIIFLEEVIAVILGGEVIECYPDDKPYPICLIVGRVRSGVPLYVLCAVNELVHIMTVHWLDPQKWLDPKTRREKKYD